MAFRLKPNLTHLISSCSALLAMDCTRLNSVESRFRFLEIFCEKVVWSYVIYSELEFNFQKAVFSFENCETRNQLLNEPISLDKTIHNSLKTFVLYLRFTSFQRELQSSNFMVKIKHENLTNESSDFELNTFFETTVFYKPLSYFKNYFWQSL